MTDDDIRAANETASARGAKRHAAALEEREIGELRDWFAGQALAGCCRREYPGPGAETEVARQAYRIADAMLAAREPRPKRDR